MKDLDTILEDLARHSPDLIAHIQAATENQKALLARELHDELGGLLVGAVMDIAWAEQHVDAQSTDLKNKLTRARQTLAAAIDLKRSLIEELRPTLLDNVGLFAALRWHVQALCTRASIPCTIHMPDEEARFAPNTPINLFRIVQEAFAMATEGDRVGKVDFTVTVTDQLLTITITTGASAVEPEESRENSHAVEAIAYRTAMLGGKFKYDNAVPGVTTMTASFPSERTFAAA
jgi:signal transduction histidine kinase